MPHVIACPQCRQQLGVPQPAPTRIRCPKCKTVISTASLKVPLAAVAPGRGSAQRESTDDEPAMGGKAALLCGGGAGLALLLIAVVILVAMGRVGKGKKTDLAEDEKGVDLESRGPKTPRKLTKRPLDEKSKQVVEEGVKYLRSQVRKKGSFHLGTRIEPGRMALAGLTLLECGVPANDEDIQRVADYVSDNMSEMKTVYTVAPALLFLDRLHRGKSVPAQDRQNIQTLALRLVAGQTRPLNLWNYDVPLLDRPGQEADVLDQLQRKGTYDGPGPSATMPDLSSSQFAALALWAARRHKLPVEGTLRAAADSVRKNQLPDGSWRYYVTVDRNETHKDTGTCVGLILLALGQGVREGGPGQAFVDDASVKKAVDHLGDVVNRVKDPPGRPPRLGNRFESWGDLYFLWTLERTALILDLPTIGGQDWHRWGTEIIVPHLIPTEPGIYWADAHPGVADTCFALLFLVQADLFQDLADKLRHLAMLVLPGDGLASLPPVPRGRM